MPLPFTPLDPVALTLDLARVPSISGAESEVVATVEQLLRGRGWEVQRIPVSPGRDDILATTGTPPVLTLSTHLDTVPPFIAPRLDGDRLSGRGSCDAKGIAAAMICAAERLRADGTAVALLFVIGEESSHDGATAANDVPTTSRILINGEPTERVLATGTKGALVATLRTMGRAAHSAYPHLGHSATRDLVRLLASLDAVVLPTDPVLGATTVNIGMVSGGVAENVVAPSAEARIMVRLVGPSDTVESRLRDWAEPKGNLEFTRLVPPVLLRTVPGFETGVVAFATDIPRLTNWGTPYLFGPGSIHVAHTDHEFVSAADLVRAVDDYVRLAGAALAAAEAPAATAV
jgi:acetylornithine deacetylase/succinyl-diaminopimelate desuccinylase-like protein